MVQALLKNYPNLIKLGLMYILTTYQLALARLHLSFSFSEDGTSTQSAYLDSLPSSVLLFAQKMTTVSLELMKSARCSTTTTRHSRI